MGIEVPATIYASIGRAVNSEDEPAVALRPLLEELAHYWGGTIELWTTAPDGGALTRLATSDGGDPPIGSGPASATGTARSPALVHDIQEVPLVARGQQRGVLRIYPRAGTAPPGGVEAWLAPVAPLLALLVHTLNAEASGGSRAAPTTTADHDRVLEALRLELARARRARSSCALLLCAADQLGERASGDEREVTSSTPEAFAGLLRETCRDSDLIGPLDGGRFAIVLAGSDGQGAQIAADRLLSELKGRAAWPLSASIGIAVFPVDGFSADELLESAALALAEARRLGGNRVAAA